MLYGSLRLSKSKTKPIWKENKITLQVYVLLKSKILPEISATAKTKYIFFDKKKRVLCYDLKKKSCHKNLILGKHILCLHKVATMGPASIIPVICALPCFSNNSVRGHAIDPNRYFTLSFGIRKLK